MSSKMDDAPDNDSEDTFSDFEVDENIADVKKERSPSSNSDEFDLSAQPKRLRLKPSKRQRDAESAEKPTEPAPNDLSLRTEHEAADEDEDGGIAIQSEILSQYLKPTTILSKYQNAAPTDAEPQKQKEEANADSDVVADEEWPSMDIEQPSDAAAEAEFEVKIDLDESMAKSEFEEMSFASAYQYLSAEAEREVATKSIVTEDFREVGWCAYLSMLLFGGGSISLKSDALDAERDGVFKMAQLKLDLRDTAHVRLLQTLWVRLSGEDAPCAKTGAHWQRIGFQGNDPTTDVRGSGMFGLLQLLFLVESHADLAAKLRALSHCAHQHFPMAVVAFSLSAIVIRLLRARLTYVDIKRRGSAMHSVNVLFAALFFEFYLRWKTLSRTVVDFDVAQKELEHKAFADWKGLIKQLEQRGQQREQHSKQRVPGHSDDDDDGEELKFGASRANQKAKKSKKNVQSRYEAK